MIEFLLCPQHGIIRWMSMAAPCFPCLWVMRGWVQRKFSRKDRTHAKD